MNAIGVFAQMILMGELTEEEADEIWGHMQFQMLPAMPSQVLEEIRRERDKLRETTVQS